jgi:phosphatidylserine synthase
MQNSDSTLVIAMIVSSIIMLTISTISMIKTKDKDKFIDYCMVFALGLAPPAALLVIMIILTLSVIYLLFGILPEFIFNKFKK